MAKPGRNDPCPCGSGEKYKRCCLPKDEAARPNQAPSSPLSHVSSVFTTLPAAAPFPHGAGAWPIVRAYVPAEDVWRATGLGTTLIVRRRPDGLLAWAMFKLDLRNHGIELMGGKFDVTAAGIDQVLEQLREHMPSFEEGPPELVSAYVWGAWALGEEEGYPLLPGTAEPFLALVPRPPGPENGWLARLVGPGGLTPRRLVQLMASLPPDDQDEKHETAVATTMRFHLADPPAAIALLRASRPQSKGYRFIPGERPESDDGGVSFDFARPLPEGPRSMMPVRGDLQIQGQVQVKGDELLATALTLSMAARLVAGLREVLGGGLALVDTSWVGPEQLARVAAWRPTRRSIPARR